jgi:hypothetical protein
MAVLARAGRRQVDGGDLFLVLVNALLSAPADIVHKLRDSYNTHGSLMHDQQMPAEIHPNWNWLRGSRWTWEDGARDLWGLAAVAQLRSELQSQAYSALDKSPSGADALRHVIFRADGALFSARTELQAQHSLGSSDQIHRHAKALETAVLSTELDNLELTELHRLAVKRSAILPPHSPNGENVAAVSVPVGEPPSRKKLTATLLQRGAGAELLAALQAEKRSPTGPDAPQKPFGRAEPVIPDPGLQRCRPCADDVGSSSAASGGTVCGRWSANATHVFVAWKSCGVHVLQPLGQRDESKGYAPPSLRSTLAGTKIGTATADWLTMLTTVFDRSSDNGGAVAAVGGTRAYPGASKWRRAA